MPADRVPVGRVVRCARCDSSWTPLPEPEPEPHEALGEAEPEAPAEDALEPVQEAGGDDGTEAVAAEPQTPLPSAADRYATSPGVVRHPTALRAAWALSGVVLLAAMWLAYSARDRVMHAWPPSVRAYAALGLANGHH